MEFAFTLYSYHPFGGLQRDFRRFHDEARRRGHRVRVYCAAWHGEQPPGSDVVILPVRGVSNHARTAHLAALALDAIRREPVDAVLGFIRMPGLDVYYAADACFVFKSRLKHGFLYRLTPRYRQYASLENAVFGADSRTRLLMISEAETARYLQVYPQARQRMALLPPGIDADRRRPDDFLTVRQQMREALGISPHEKLLLFIGSGFIKKGLDRVIRALASLSPATGENTRLLVVGEDRADRFRRLAASLGVESRVDFAGGREDVASLLLAGDLLVHPAQDEAAGIVLLEALVAGLPVITTDVCGYADHIGRAGAGRVLASPFEQSKLDEALVSALENASLREQWQQGGLAYAAATDLWSMHAAGIDYLEQFVREKPV